MPWGVDHNHVEGHLTTIPRWSNLWCREALITSNPEPTKPVTEREVTYDAVRRWSQKLILQYHLKL